MKSFKRNLFIIAGIFLLNFIFIIAKIIIIDFSPVNKTRLSPAKKNPFSYVRGKILDRSENELAVSIRQTSVAINPKDISRENLKSYIPLCNLLNISFSELKKKTSRKSKFVWLKRKISPLVVGKIKQLNLKGIQFVPEYKRFYPNQSLASHVLGFVGVDNYGLSGTELFFNTELKGNENDVEHQLPQSSDNAFYKVINGKDVVLTIDSFIQHNVEKILTEAYKKYKPDSITAIVMNPNTGAVLAMANLPDFDPNKFNLFSSKSLKNRAVVEYYEPGSTFKIITTAALLKKNLLPLNHHYFCKGYIKVGGRRIKCWKKHGDLTYDEILKESCNTGVIDRALHLNRKFFFSVIRDFGFGNYTGIELPGEVSGILRRPDKWTLFSKAAVSIGQEIGVTPIQLISAVSAVANGGTLYQPHIVKEVRYNDKTIFKQNSPFAVRSVLSMAQAKEISRLLVKVTEKDGTGTKAHLEGYQISGKTGTAQVFDNKAGRYYKNRHIVSFVGYYPSRKPEISILVVVRNPKIEDPSGGKIAAPIFHDIAVSINSYLHIYPVKSPLVPVNKNYFKKLKNNFPVRSKGLPNFVGMNIRESSALVGQLHLVPNFIGSGSVYKQFPEPDTEINTNLPLTLWFK